MDVPKHMQPLSAETQQRLAALGMTESAPIMIRIFKEEGVLEVWKQDATGRYALFKTYVICAWSGSLGPKLAQGDRQAPEGFYMITPGLMNPNSSYYLSFNTGFPNAYDRANGRTGSFLMVHGSCSSAGCYAMTDEQMGEIYALAREAFEGGQQAFELQAFPFRMTPENMARHRDNPNFEFWQMLKEGYDHFELTRLPPRIDVCDGRYVFDAVPASGQSFVPTGPCPEMAVPDALAFALQARQASDAARFLEVVAALDSGAPIPPAATEAAAEPPSRGLFSRIASMF